MGKWALFCLIFILFKVYPELLHQNLDPFALYMVVEKCKRKFAKSEVSIYLRHDWISRLDSFIEGLSFFYQATLGIFLQQGRLRVDCSYFRFFKRLIGCTAVIRTLDFVIIELKLIIDLLHNQIFALFCIEELIVTVFTIRVLLWIMRVKRIQKFVVICWQCPKNNLAVQSLVCGLLVHLR